MPPPQMSILNAPEREACIARRERTNTPLQALLLMNEPEFLKAQSHVAREVITKKNFDDKQKLNYVYEKLTSKQLNKEQLGTLESLIIQLREHYLKNADDTKELANLLGAEQGLDQVELASWTLLVNSIYNLDIMKTRE